MSHSKKRLGHTAEEEKSKLATERRDGETSTSPASAVSAADTAPVQSITILLAEDNAGDQMLFKLSLAESTNTQLHIVSDGSEALRFLCKEGHYVEAPDPDLVVLDLNLPKLTGDEILTEIKRNPFLNHLPVVIFSGAKPTDAVLNVCRGANFYIVKPDVGDQYFAVVQSLEQYCRNVLRAPESAGTFAEQLQRFLKDSENCAVYIPGSIG